MPRILPLGLALLPATQASAQSPPIVLLEPAGSQQLTGTIQIRLKADAAQIVVAGLGGAPWTELTKTDAGEWTGVWTPPSCRTVGRK